VPQFSEYIHAGILQVAKDGFVSIHEAGAESLHIAALQHLKTSQSLPIRIYAMLSARDIKLAIEWHKKALTAAQMGF
jgi:hypothetical protein